MIIDLCSMLLRIRSPFGSFEIVHGAAEAGSVASTEAESKVALLKIGQ